MRSRGLCVVFVSVLLLGVAAYADTSTSPMNCTPYPAIFTGSVGSTTVSCPAFTVSGATLTGAQLTYLADYQFGTTSSNTIQVVFTPGGPAGVTWTPTSNTLTVTGSLSSTTTPPQTASATAGISNSAFSSAFNVAITSSVVSGGAATSSGAVSIVYTYVATIGLTCPASTGTVGTPYNSSLVASGGISPYTYSILTGSLPPPLMLNASTGAITGTPTTAGPFTFTAQVVDSRSGTADSTTANCTITIQNTPPPPTGTCATAAASVTFGIGTAPVAVQPENSFLVRYAANLDKGDSVIDVVNSGLNGAPLLGPGFGTSVGNLCVNVYTFSPDEQLISCCSCLVTPDGLASFSVNNDLLNTTLTGVIPTSVTVKLVGSTPGTNTLAGGVMAWGTTIHATPVVGTYGTAETRFVPSTLSAGELASITGRCASILGNGSGFGICRSCRAGGLGAAKQ